LAYVEQVARDCGTVRPGGSRVFLTGATGYLGAFILRDLVARGSAVCALVRAADHGAARQRLVANLRLYGIRESVADGVRVVCGDVALDDFGLGAGDAAELARCGTLIHNAACVDFGSTLGELEEVNVRGVGRAAALALRHGLYMVHVSSVSVFSLHQFTGSGADTRPDPTLLINGYARSKWVGEQVVRQSMALGLRGCIVRPGRIMGASDSGASSVQDWFIRYIQAVVRSGVAWDLDHHTDMTQVDDVSRVVVGACDPAGHGRSLMAVSLHTLTSHQIADIVRGYGYGVASIPYAEWIERAARGGAGASFAPLLETFRSLPIVDTAGAPMQFASDMYHSGGGGEETFHRMMRWFVAHRVLPRPPGPGVYSLDGSGAPVAAPAGAPVAAPVAAPAGAPAGAPDAGPDGVGILAMAAYTPGKVVSQAAMEAHDGCPGKYTKGLSQVSIGFCDANEDAVSMALSAVERLMAGVGVGWDQIGRLEVGTESLVDRSKSVKTFVARLFAEHGNADLAGVDNYNACYGGTAALLNCVDWARSPDAGGRYAVAVAVDVADLHASQAFLNGASCVAMLVGRGAALEVAVGRGHHFLDTTDFYKPVGWKDPFPLMRDGQYSIECYMQCLEGCYASLARQLGQEDVLAGVDYCVFHCTSVYLCKRAFKKLASLSASTRGLGLGGQLAAYERMVQPSTVATSRIGSSYTASCYTNLYSLAESVGPRGLDGKTVLVFSYGSGSASGMYKLQGRGDTQLCTQLSRMLDGRAEHTPESYLAAIERYSGMYGSFGVACPPLEPCASGDALWSLEGVDEWGKRSYARVQQ
jgi:thioester reductase-like protein